MLRGAQHGGEGKEIKRKKELKVKMGNITVVLKFFEMDSWGQVKDK